MAEIEPLDRQYVPPADQRRGRYPWDQWLVPGTKVTCRQPVDFPDAKPESFRSAAYSAARRMKVTATVSLSRRAGVNIAEIRTYPEEGS